MIEIQRRGEVTILRMAHGKANALDLAMLRDLEAAMRGLDVGGRSSFVLTGTGSVFSAGVDLVQLLEGGDDYLDLFLPALDRCLRLLFTLDRPLVAAVNGHAIAGGCVMACACDYRLLVQEGASMGLPELRVGVPFPSMAIEIVRHAVGPSFLRKAIAMGRYDDPHKALEHELVDELCPPDQLLERACAAAEELGRIPPASYRLNKRMLRQPALDLLDRHDPTWSRLVRETWGSAEARAAITQYVEAVLKRKPK
jgi:enoyl-CoA hydratase